MLDSQLDELASFLDRAEARSAEVSGWTVGQQVEHVLLTVRGVAAEIYRTRDKPGKTKLTIVGRLVFRSGSIPRGRGQAPDAVRVDDQPSLEQLERSLAKARSALAHFDTESPNGQFHHPYFGRLDQKGAVRFLEIHTEHHLAIIREIAGSK